MSASCGSWSCDWCAQRKLGHKRARIRKLILAAQRVGFSTYLLTLTFRSETSRADLQACWNRLATSLRRTAGLVLYATSLESNQAHRGLHLHVVLVTATPVRGKAVRAAARRAGFGPNIDLEPIGTTPRDAARVASYLLKGTVALARNHRVRRPVNFSRGALVIASRGDNKHRGPWRRVPAADRSVCPGASGVPAMTSSIASAPVVSLRKDTQEFSSPRDLDGDATAESLL